MDNSLLARTLYFAEKLSKIPNAPFLHGPMLAAILGCLAEMGIRDFTDSHDLSRGVFACDDYALYVRFKRGSASRPLLIDSHLDHPAFVLNGRGQALAFGSIGSGRIKSLLKHGPIDLRIFAPSGEFLTLGRLTDLQLFKAQVETSITVPANSHGLWNVTDFAVDSGHLRMHSADNMIATDVMLTLIEKVAASSAHFPNLDVTFVFTFLEEVFEASATALAMRGRTPFDPIAANSIIIVLEAMEAVPLPAERRSITLPEMRQSRLADDSQAVSSRTLGSIPDTHPLYDRLALPPPNPDGGLAIKINDFDCVYGFAFREEPNLAESLLLNLAEDVGVTYQHTLYGGACNGTAFSLFPTTSHIATLSIPNPFKHNLFTDGTIVAEQVKVRDVDAMARVLSSVLEQAGDEPVKNHPRAISHLVKSTDLVPDTAATRRLRAERGTIAWSARRRLRQGRYFAESLPEQVGDNLRRISSRARQRLFRSLG